MNFLSMIAGSVVGPLVDKLIAPLTDIFKAYINKQITVEQLREQMVAALLGAFQAVEVSHSDTLGKTYASFMQAATQSRLMQWVWGSTVISQVLVLIWHQVGIPALCFFEGVKACYPSSGTTVEWAYLLVAGLMGLGPVVLRAGPAAPNVSAWKALIGK